jgi:hypothetical protein
MQQYTLFYVYNYVESNRAAGSVAFRISFMHGSLQRSMAMRNDMEVKIGSTIYERINASRMSDAERQAAINAMHDAELIADAIVWVTKKIEQLGARLFLKPSPRH